MIVPDPIRVTVGAATSMLATVAVVDPVFPALSTKLKVNDPLAAKVKVFDPELLVIVIASEAPVSVATTDPEVARSVE